MGVIAFHLHPQREQILQRMRDMTGAVLARSQREGKAWARLIDTESAFAIFEHLAENELFAGELHAAVLNDSHLLVYSVGAMWFAPAHKLLIEQFFVRVGHGVARFAFDDIEQLGRHLGTSGVLMATMLMPDEEAGQRLYEQHGYTRQCSQHFKELT